MLGEVEKKTGFYFKIINCYKTPNKYLLLNALATSCFILDRIKFYGMLDGLNNEIKKIKELFLKNTNSNSFFNNNNSNNPITNRSTEMSAGEDFIDNEKCRSTEQMMHKNSTDHDLCSKRNYNTNQSIIKGIFQNNEDCMNTQNTYICQNVLQQENDEEFYQIQLSDIKIENLNNMEHFITWQNLYVCQCGTIYNKN